MTNNSSTSSASTTNKFKQKTIAHPKTKERSLKKQSVKTMLTYSSTRSRELKLEDLKQQPMEPLDYLAKEEPYLQLEEWGGHSRACRVLEKVTGCEFDTIRRHWGKRFEKCPNWAKLALRKDHLLNAIARQDYSLQKMLA